MILWVWRRLRCPLRALSVSDRGTSGRHLHETPEAGNSISVQDRCEEAQETVFEADLVLFVINGVLLAIFIFRAISFPPCHVANDHFSGRDVFMVVGPPQSQTADGFE